MRKQPPALSQNNKENRYDQFTNLGIDLEHEINKSVVLPRIYNKAAQKKLKQYARRQEDQQNLHRLKYEVDNLKRHIFTMNQQGVSHRFNQQLDKSRYADDYYPSPRDTEHIFQQNLQNLDQSKYKDRVRMTRNTAKNQQNLKRDQHNYIALNRKDAIDIKQASPPMVRLDIAKHPRRNIQKNIIKTLTTQNQKIKTSKKRVRRSHKLRKFRICVYAVYFALLIPAYARKIYKNRLALFIRDFPYQVTQYFNKKQQVPISKFKSDEFKLWCFFAQKIDILGMVQKDDLGSCFKKGNQVKGIKSNFNYLMSSYQVKSSDKSIEQPPNFQEQLVYPKNIQFLLPKIKVVFELILNGFYQNLSASDFLNNKWKTVDLGLMNNSFINNSHPKLPAFLIDCGIVRLHPYKEYLLVYDQQTEVLLLINDLLCRIYIYKWFNRLRKLKSSQQHSEENLVITTFALTIFYVACSQLVQEKVNQYIKANHKLDQKSRNRNKRIRSINSLIIGSKKGVKLQKGNLIADPPQYQSVLQIVKSHPDFMQQIKEMIKESGAELHQKIKTYKKNQFLQIKDKTAQQQNTIRDDKRNRQKVATLNSQYVLQNESEEQSSSKPNLNPTTK